MLRLLTLTGSQVGNADQFLAGLFADLSKLEGPELTGDKGRNAQLDAWLIAQYAERRSIRIAKNADYGAAWRQMGLQGLICRMADKMARIVTLGWFAKDPQVKSESLRDTLLDLANYIDFALYCLEEKNIDGSILRD
jgi:hypothetical protein